MRLLVLLPMRIANPVCKFKCAGGAYGHAATGSYDYGDPTIRYLPSDGHYSPGR
jgi:hypothetical protein